MHNPRLLPTLTTTFALALIAAATPAEGAATVAFNSTIGATNLRSDGTPMTTDFAFQIGSFAGGFEPTANNTSEWLAHWVPLSDAAADPIPEATAPYEYKQLPPPFPDDAVTAGFSGAAVYDHNEPPFSIMGPVYIWGYDNRTRAGTAEWILVSSSTWGWPDGTSNLPAVTFSVGDADTVILGAVNGDNFHMQSAGVTVEAPSQSGGYDAWLAANFSPGVLADAQLADSVWGVLADPDNDGAANLIEFFTASNPNDSGSKRDTAAAIEGDHLIFSFYQTKDVTGVVGTVEWSTDLTHWQSDGVTIQNVEDLGDALLVHARVPLGGHPEKSARLNVRRAFD